MQLRENRYSIPKALRATFCGVILAPIPAPSDRIVISTRLPGCGQNRAELEELRAMAPAELGSSEEAPAVEPGQAKA